MLQKERILRQSGIVAFDRRVIANLLQVSYPSTNPILDRLVRARVLTRLRRDRYVLTETMSRQTRKIANELIKPSALSLWTVLSDTGMTTQVPRVIQSVTPKRPADIAQATLPTFSYAHLPADLFFGMTPDAEGIFRMAPEKALLDLLYVQKGMIDWNSIDTKRFDRQTLRAFAKRFPLAVQNALASSPLRA